MQSVCFFLFFEYSFFKFYCFKALTKFVSNCDANIVKVCVDGSLYKKHPRMDSLLNRYLAQLCPHKQVKVFLAEGGSAIGAALLAAVYK